MRIWINGSGIRHLRWRLDQKAEEGHAPHAWPDIPAEVHGTYIGEGCQILCGAQAKGEADMADPGSPMQQTCALRPSAPVAPSDFPRSFGGVGHHPYYLSTTAYVNLSKGQGRKARPNSALPWSPGRFRLIWTSPRAHPHRSVHTSHDTPAAIMAVQYLPTRFSQETVGSDTTPAASFRGACPGIC